MLQVVAAIIERDGRVLICRRRPDQRHGLQWEFPGGKVEAGETPAHALARELHEELGVRDAVGAEIERYEHAYPGRTPIELIFIRVTGFDGEPRNLIFQEMTWEARSNLTDFDFVEGDRRFLEVYTRQMATPIKMADPAENQFLASLEEKGRGPNHFFRTMGRRPEVLKNFVPLYGAIVSPGTVDRRTKELVYLACSYANECAYCTAAHVASSSKAGVTDDERRAIQTEQDHIFSEAERAVLQFARELTRTATADESRAALLEHFNDEQVVEIALVAAMANFTNRFNNALGVMPED